MTIGWQEELRPGLALRGIVQQATAALVAMDAERLEELARCCVDLNREWEDAGGRAEASFEMQGAAGDLALLGAVLQETRANLTVLTRLHAIRLREALAKDRHSIRSRGDAGRMAFPLRPRLERTPDYGDN